MHLKKWKTPISNFIKLVTGAGNLFNHALKAPEIIKPHISIEKAQKK